MCFGGGGGKSADQYYEEMKVEPQPLPSLRMRPRTGEDELGRVGGQRRSLFRPYRVRDQ